MNRFNYVMILCLIVLTIQEGICSLLDDIYFEGEKKDYFIELSYGYHQEILQHYRDNLKKGHDYFPRWDVEDFDNQVPVLKLGIGYGLKKGAAIFSIGKLNRNTAIFTFDNAEEGFNSISASFIQITYRYHLTGIPWDKELISKKNKRFIGEIVFPYAEIGADYYLVSWEWKSDNRGWIVYDAAGQQVGQPLYHVSGNSKIIGVHGGFGFSLRLGEKLLFGMKLTYVQAYTDKIYGDFVQAGGRCYWWGQPDYMKFDLSGISSLAKICYFW